MQTARQEKKEKEKHFRLLIIVWKIGLRQRERTKRYFIHTLNIVIFLPNLPE